MKKKQLKSLYNNFHQNCAQKIDDASMMQALQISFNHNKHKYNKFIGKSIFLFLYFFLSLYF